jgi:hypothetical protein
MDDDDDYEMDDDDDDKAYDSLMEETREMNQINSAYETESKVKPNRDTNLGNKAWAKRFLDDMKDDD